MKNIPTVTTNNRTLLSANSEEVIFNLGLDISGRFDDTILDLDEVIQSAEILINSTESIARAAEIQGLDHIADWMRSI